MDSVKSMAQDEAVSFIETLRDVRSEEVGRATVYYGTDTKGTLLYVVLPLAGDALIIAFSPQLHPDY